MSEHAVDLDQPSAWFHEAAHHHHALQEPCACTQQPMYTMLAEAASHPQYHIAGDVHAHPVDHTDSRLGAWDPER